MRRRLIAAVVMVLGLAACGGAGTGTTEAAMTATTMHDEMMTDTTMHDEMMTDTTMADEMMSDTTMADEMMSNGDLGAVTMEQTDLSVFLGLLESTGVIDQLHGDGPFTVFAPTDDAFADYLSMTGMTQDDLTADPAALAQLVENHVVAGKDEPSDMVMGMAGESFTSLSGLALDITVDGDTVMVNDATIVRYDLEATNGVIHVIDHVLASPEG